MGCFLKEDEQALELKNKQKKPKRKNLPAAILQGIFWAQGQMLLNRNEILSKLPLSSLPLAGPDSCTYNSYLMVVTVIC